MSNNTDSTIETQAADDVRLTKKERAARYNIWYRYSSMQADTLRIEAEKQWDYADQVFRQYIPSPDPDDWRAHLQLPDAFAAIQAQMQETIERKSRPLLKRVEDSDQKLEEFANAIMTYNMNRTGFDYQMFMAKYSAAIRGTAFLMDYYRVDKRKVKDATSVDKEGKLEYTDKEIIDFDDDYTEWVSNEFIYIDPDAKHIDEAKDMIWREIIDVKEFHRKYGFKGDFMNVEKVKSGGETQNKAYFKMPKDMNENHVEVLHYYNRATDEYNVLANNVLVRMGPLPYKHKELPIAVIYHYQVPGYFWGIGIPQVIRYLTEERRAIRNLNLDRQKMQLNKMFLKSSNVDMDEEETITRPFGIIEVDTNGLPLNQAMQPLEYGDVPASYFRTEEIILEDIRRAHGIDDRIQGVNMGGTATEAAILKESSQRRINLITSVSEMDTVRRIGKLKWSNLQFFYPAPRVERVFQENEEREEKVYKKINVQDKEFTIVKGGQGNELQLNEIAGTSSFKLDKTMAKFMEGDVDVVVDANASTVVSKPIQQSKVTEMFNTLMANPLLSSVIDPEKAVARYVETNDESPKKWMKKTKSKDEMEQIADWENMIMASGTPLAPTEDATPDHTMVHLHFTETVEFSKLPQDVQALITNHITGEHDANPATGMSADLMGAPTPGGGAPAGMGGPGGPAVSPGPVQIQPADLQASTVTGEAPNSGKNQNVALQ